MKNKYVSIIFSVFVVGVLFGTMEKEYSRENSVYINKDKIAKKQIHSTKKSIKILNKEKEELELELESLKSKDDNKKESDKIESIKYKLSYTDIKGEGLVIKVDALNEEIGNIANFIDYNKILLNIINDLKLNGADFISINEERLNQYSEVVLAGNHININSVPIAPPYNIKAIGNIDKLTAYVEKSNSYLTNLQVNYPIKINYKISKKLTMNKMNVTNKLNYIMGD